MPGEIITYYFSVQNATECCSGTSVGGWRTRTCQNTLRCEISKAFAAVTGGIHGPSPQERLGTGLILGQEQ